MSNIIGVVEGAALAAFGGTAGIEADAVKIAATMFSKEQLMSEAVQALPPQIEGTTWAFMVNLSGFLTIVKNWMTPFVIAGVDGAVVDPIFVAVATVESVLASITVLPAAGSRFWHHLGDFIAAIQLMLLTEGVGAETAVVRAAQIKAAEDAAAAIAAAANPSAAEISAPATVGAD